MTKTKSAKKAYLTSERKRKYNLQVQEKIKTTIKRFRKDKKSESLKKIFSLLDRAVAKKVIHKNTASRLKSRLFKLIKREKALERPKRTKKSKK